MSNLFLIVRICFDNFILFFFCINDDFLFVMSFFVFYLFRNFFNSTNIQFRLINTIKRVINFLIYIIVYVKFFVVFIDEYHMYASFNNRQ